MACRSVAVEGGGIGRAVIVPSGPATALGALLARAAQGGAEAAERQFGGLAGEGVGPGHAGEVDEAGVLDQALHRYLHAGPLLGSGGQQLVGDLRELVEGVMVLW